MLSIAAYLPRQGGRIRGAAGCLWRDGAHAAPGDAPSSAFWKARAWMRATIARAAQVAVEGLDPPTDALATAWYRREVAGVHLKRLLERMARG